MQRSLVDIKDFIEWKAFGVCTAIGDRIGVATSRIRLWFIYISFLNKFLAVFPVQASSINVAFCSVKRYFLFTYKFVVDAFGI